MAISAAIVLANGTFTVITRYPANVISVDGPGAVLLLHSAPIWLGESPLRCCHVARTNSSRRHSPFLFLLSQQTSFVWLATKEPPLASFVWQKDLQSPVYTGNGFALSSNYPAHRPPLDPTVLNLDRDRVPTATYTLTNTPTGTISLLWSFLTCNSTWITVYT